MGNETRLDVFRKVLEDEKLDGMLVTSVVNVTWLSGFTGDSSFALITPDRRQLITDFRYVEQAEEECPGWDVLRHQKGIFPEAGRSAKALGLKRLGFESAHLSCRNHEKLSEVLDGVETVGLEGKVEALRTIKGDEEVQAIEAALRCQEDAFREVKSWVKPGMTEKEVAAELEYRMKRNGAERSAFETIVAAGERGSLPHAHSTERVIRQGEALLVDWGARRFFYNSDLTRVLHFGTVHAKFTEVYELVGRAQKAAIAHIRPGVTLSEIDAAARDVIRDAGHGEQFGHALGHGVGLEVHEAPTVKEGNEEPVRPGMVFTVEPGIYIPRWGGVRIEDMVLVTEDGVRVLSSLEKDLDAMIL